MEKLVLFLFVVSTTTAEASVGLGKLEEVFAWKRFTFKDQGLAGQNGTRFDFPMGLDRYHNKLFLGFPRRNKDSSMALGYVDLCRKGKSPEVIPYPSAEYNDLNTQSDGKFVTVYRPKVDSCNRLWILDVGTHFGKSAVIQQPSIVIIDLQTDKVISNYTLISKRDVLFNNPGGLVSIAIDIVGGDCQNAFAYIPDIYHPGLLVYSLKSNDSWRVKHNYFALDPEEGDFDINGLKFQYSDGIFSVALGPAEGPSFYRTAYFHALASHKERAVSTQVFRNKTLATRTYHGNDFWVVGSRGERSNVNAHAIDKTTGVMFSAQAGLNAVSCWNPKKNNLTKETSVIFAKDDELLLYPSDLKIDSDRMLWILTNKYPFYTYSTLNPDEYNFRVYRAPVDDAIAGTDCEIVKKRRIKNYWQY